MQKTHFYLVKQGFYGSTPILTIFFLKTDFGTFYFKLQLSM